MKLLNLASNNSFWRGIDYHHENRIISCKELAENCYQGKVRGSGNAVYDVTIDTAHPRKSACNCPFAEGRRVICKHMIALDLGIPSGSAVFVEIRDGEEVTSEYLLSFAQTLLAEGYTPGFKVSTDAKDDFDREFSRGMKLNQDVFMNCLIWATTPTEPEYDGMTTSHLIHPDHWKPFAPSGTNRNAIGIWQYGRKCHPIEDDDGTETTFDLNLVKNEQVIVEKMF